MVELSERKIEIVRTLVEAAPDRVVGGLQAALAETVGDPTLAGVRRLVETEAADRRLRNTVLVGVAPMCVGDGKDSERLVFPARTLALIWRGLKDEAPEEVGEAALLLTDFRPGETSPELFDALARRAAEGLRVGERKGYRQALELAEAARLGAGAQLCACMDLAPVVRGILPRLPDWISRITEERTAAVRCAYRDAVAIAEDAGPQFFEMLAAQLAEPWRVLHIIAAVMDRPNERYLAGSELAPFAVRLMDELDGLLKQIHHFNVDGGPSSARAAAQVVELVTQQIAELEESIELHRESPWGSRVAGQKRALASVVEGRLKDVEKALDAALPTHVVRIARMNKVLPRFTAEPDPKAVNRAITLLSFAEEIRGSANYGGFASARAKMLEKVGEILDNYVEEALDRIRSGEATEEEVAIAQAFLAVAADISSLARDPKAAEVVRRRAAAA